MKKLTSRSLLFALAFALPQTAVAFDADHDGTKDALDAFPCDVNGVGATFYPAVGDHGMIMFEDLWPNLGDRDFNDVVVSYNYIHKLDANNDVTQIRATINPIALGSTIRSGLGLELPVARSAVASVVLKTWDKVKNEEVAINLTMDPNETNLDVVISDNLREFFDYYGSAVNTDPAQARLHGRVIELYVTMWQPTTMNTNAAPYDMYIFYTDDPSHEIHRPEYGGTSAMNTALFNTGDDASTATRRFVATNGLPFAIVFPTLVPHALEGTPIETLFPNIVAWAASGGTTNTDFYTNGVNVAAAYTDVDGLPAPAPGFNGPADLPAETSCIQDWGLAVDWGTLASRYSYGATVNAAGQTTITGYTRSAFTNFTNAGGLDFFVGRFDAANGNQLWVQQLGTAGDETGRDVATDASGNVYVAGDTEGALGGQTNAGGSDAFVMKLDATGNILWTRLFGGGGNETGYGVAVDASGNVYVTGGSTSSSLPGATAPANTPAVFLVKYDAMGTRQWTQHYVPDAEHGSNYGYATDVEVDPAPGGDVYIVGSERRFSAHPTAADNQFLVRHASNSGAIDWVEHIGEFGYRLTNTDYQYGHAFGVAIDDFDGSAYVVGAWSGKGQAHWNQWQRGSGDYSSDATITKFNNRGQGLWQYGIASTDGQDDFAWGVVADGVGGAVYVTGRTSGALPGQIHRGYTDYFVVSYAYDGTPRWTWQDGSNAFESGHQAAVHSTSQSSGSVYVVGNSVGGSPNWSTWEIIMTTLDITDGSFVDEHEARRLGWVIGPPQGTCNVQCGEGTQARTVTCVRADGTPAPDSECAAEAHPGNTGPCWNWANCYTDWNAAAWGSCSTTCGNGTQTRTVTCQRNDGIIYPETDCDASSRPADVRSCTDVSTCTYAWNATAWGTCSAGNCATGTQTRSVSCLRSDGTVVEGTQCSGTAPITVQACAGTCTGQSCASLLTSGQTTSGTYTIDPDGSGSAAPIQVYCDMTTNGGGWTNLDFANNRVHLENGHFIACTNGLSSTASSVTCAGPYFDGNTSQPLYHYLCNGSDRSADYLLDHVAPLLGHQGAATLGYATLSQMSDFPTFGSSTGDNEYCYINGNVVRYDQGCAAYSNNANGNCIPAYFMLTR